MSFLAPESVAVVGASATEGKMGHYILRNLLTQGYRGSVFPVNPKYTELLGVSAYPSLADIPKPVDMAVVVTPARSVPAVLDDCGARGVQTVVVISAGFGEVHTNEGDALEQQIIEKSRQYGFTLVGPNCLGVLRPSIGLNASFASAVPPAGNVALVSQSGAMAVALMDSAGHEHIHFSFVASIGNKTMVDEADFLEKLANDDETKVIGFYLESIKDGRRFLEAAHRVTQKKPVVLLKSGVSEHGRKAAASHTGSLAGSDAAIEAVCAQAGIHRADTAEQFLDLLRVLSTQPPLLSRRIAVVTNAGGPGILATDAAEFHGLTLTSLEPKRAEALKQALPAAASVSNPIDVLGDAEAAPYQAALKACGDDPNVDGLVVLLTPQVMTPAADIARIIAEETRQLPLTPVVTSFMGGESVEEAIAVLAERGIPNYESPARAIAALAALLPHESDVRTSVTNTERQAQAASLLGFQTGLLPEEVSKSLFELYDLPLPMQSVATTVDEAIAVANSMGYPVIAKISSPEILHKTDVGGIKANLQNDDELSAAYESIMASCTSRCPNAAIRGVLIQQFLPVGNEFIIGSTRDPSFGPLIMVGLGGIYTELFKDTSFRIAPVNTVQAYQMLQDLKSWQLLLGMRGKEQRDIHALADIVVRVSQMVSECSQITELDINPVLVGSKEIVIADVKVVVS